jgi:hypothetical protein
VSAVAGAAAHACDSPLFIAVHRSEPLPAAGTPSRPAVGFAIIVTIVVVIIAASRIAGLAIVVIVIAVMVAFGPIIVILLIGVVIVVVARAHRPFFVITVVVVIAFIVSSVTAMTGLAAHSRNAAALLGVHSGEPSAAVSAPLITIVPILIVIVATMATMAPLADILRCFAGSIAANPLRDPPRSPDLL